jgi:Ca2+-binding RTX toxin-like protein
MPDQMLTATPTTFTARLSDGTATGYWLVTWTGTGFTYDPETGAVTGGTVQGMTKTRYIEGANGPVAFGTEYFYQSINLAVTDMPDYGTSPTWPLGTDANQYPFFGPQVASGQITDGTMVIVGGSGADLLQGGAGDDQIYGTEGGDTLRGNGGNDWIEAGPEATLIHGGVGFDFLVGGAGNDTIHGDADAGMISGGGGDDSLRGSGSVSGEAGNDIVTGGAGDDTLTGGTGRDTLTGSDGIDDMNGNDGDDILYGGAGDDMLYGEQGNDRLRGGAGFDLMFGDVGDDRLEGEDDRDLLVAGEGNDLLFGGTGDDVLLGGAGQDYLQGGAGADGFIFDGAEIATDYAQTLITVTDFADGEDMLGLVVAGAETAADVHAHFIARAVQDKRGVLYTDDDGWRVRLSKVTLAQLDETDFAAPEFGLFGLN